MGEIGCKQLSEGRILMYDFYLGTKEDIDKDPQKIFAYDQKNAAKMV